MGCMKSLPDRDIPLSYTNPHSQVIYHYRRKMKKIHRRDQLNFVTQNDSSNHLKPGDHCYLMSSIWLKNWLDYCSDDHHSNPGLISNDILLDANTDMLCAHKKLRVDFRPVKQIVWEYLFQIYGGGPVIYITGMYTFTKYIYYICVLICNMHNVI